MSRGLRIGVVLGGRLVDERIIRTGPVTLGQSITCDLSIPIDALPREHELFDAALELRAPPGARVETAGTRGKLELGELTILFQSVALAAPVPRPQLPAELRRVGFDRRLAAIVSLSFAAHGALLAWALTRDDVPLPSFIESYRDGIDVQLPDYVDRVDPTPAPTPAPTPGPGIAHEVARQPIVRASAPPPPPSQVEAQRLANIITGGDSNTGFAGMSSRSPGADLGAQIADARSTHASIDDGSHTSRVDDRARLGDGTHHLQTATQTMTTTETPSEHVPVRVDVTPDPSDPAGDPIGPDIVSKITRVYMPGLQRCYRLALAHDNSLEGKVALQLTVLESGRVVRANAAGVGDDVDRCITAQMATWRFATGHDDATYAVSLILKPGR